MWLRVYGCASGADTEYTVLLYGIMYTHIRDIFVIIIPKKIAYIKYVHENRFSFSG